VVAARTGAGRRRDNKVRGTRQPIGATERALQHRVAIRFVVTGDTRFLSHRDMLRLFERAISRADLPIRYSAGFNPRPRLWLPLPRSVGVASDDELLIVALERAETPARVRQRLVGEVPEAIALREAFELACRARPRPVEATYRLDLAGDPNPALAKTVRQTMQADRIEVRRTSKRGGRSRVVDLRDRIVRIDLAGNTLTATLRISPEGSARPAEVLELLGLDAVEMVPRFRRVTTRWTGFEPADSHRPEPT